MNFTTAIGTCFAKYAGFNGRASRSEYWFFILFVFLAIAFLAILAASLSGAVQSPKGGPKSLSVIVDGLALLFLMGIFVPTLAVGARRLHDISCSGWWQLICLVPLLGGLGMLIACCLPGTRGTNRFGPEPLASKVPVDRPPELNLNDHVLPNWNPPALAVPDDFKRRCLTGEFHDETEDRTFHSNSAFAPVLDAFGTSNFEEVIRRGTQLLPRFPDFDLPWEWVSSAYQELGKLDSAYRVASEGLPRTKRKSVLLVRLGDIEWQRGNLPETVYALSQALHCYADRPLDYNPYLLLNYIAEGAGLSTVAAAFLRRVDQLRPGTIRLPPALGDRLKEISRRSRTPVITEVLKELSTRYLAAGDTAGQGVPAAAGGLSEQGEKTRTIGELFDRTMHNARQKMNDDECRLLSAAIVAICTNGFSAAEVQKALNHPHPGVRAECETFVKTILT